MIKPSHLLLGILTYLAMLVLTIPAQQAYRWLPHAGAGPALYGLEGTVWNGRANTAMVGLRDLGSLQWRVNPLWLPLGRLRVAWTLAGGDTTGQGVLQAGFGGRLQLPALELNLPMGTLQGWVPTLPVALGGILQARLHDVALHDGHLQQVRGTLVWEQAAVEWTQPVALGALAL
ncbi:MAG: type II secretion system protein N, partial [Gammaproteobacteria bacterium]